MYHDDFHVLNASLTSPALLGAVALQRLPQRKSTFAQVSRKVVGADGACGALVWHFVPV